jgi:hypothetical protein
MFSADTIIAMSPDGICVPIGGLAALAARKDFIGRQVTHDDSSAFMIHQVAGLPLSVQLIRKPGYHTTGGRACKLRISNEGEPVTTMGEDVISAIKRDKLCQCLPKPSILTPPELALFVVTKRGGASIHYGQNERSVICEAQVRTALPVSAGEAVELATHRGIKLTCSPRTKLCLTGGGFVYADQVNNNAVLDTYTGMDTIKMVGPASSIPSIERKTAELVSIKLYTTHCVLANGLWVLTE